MSRNADSVDGFLRRRYGPLVEDSPVLSWLKRDDGRFVVTSRLFAAGLGLAHADAARVRDRDVIAAADVRRFRADDRRVLASRSPEVVLEPPDSVDEAWCSTLKVPVAGPEGRAVATLAVSLSLSALIPLEELVARPASGGEAGTPWPLAVRRRLDRLFYDEIRVPVLARLVERHPDYLARCFRRLFGATIAEYVRARRVAWAAHRLATTPQPIVEVALAAGFADQSHLTRAFRQLLGCSPARYRRAAAAREPGPEPSPLEEVRSLLAESRRR